MLRSNQKIQILVSVLALALALSACSLGTPQDRSETPEDSASFFVDKVEVSVTGTNFHPNISLPISKNYSFRACMKESQFSKPILNHRFEVSGGPETSELTSDNNGCISWAEKIEYNHLAEAHWVQTTRSIRALGIQKGQRQIALALDPWEDLGESLMNKKITAEKDAKLFVAANAPGAKGIWIDDLRLTIDEKRVSDEGLVLSVEIRTQPSFAVVKTGGRRALEPITTGSFEGEITLINVLTENKKEVRRTLMAPVKVSGKIANNALLLESRVTLPASARSGQVQLGLKLRAISAPENLGSFEGVFSVAEFDQIKGSFFSRLKNNFQEAQGKLQIADYLTEAPKAQPIKGSNEADIAKDTNTGYQKSQVQIAPLEFDNIGFRNQSSLNRLKVFTVTACMALPVDSKPLRAQVFQVQKANGTQENLRSNERGCITWEDSVEFQYLDAECWQAKHVQIANSNFSMSQNLTIQINPWADGRNSIRDTRQIGSQELKCAKGPSKITLLRYDFDKKTVHYPIDRFLNIKVQKEGILKLQARLKRPSLLDGSGYEDIPLPAGKYRLRWAIVDHAVHDFSKAAHLIYQAQEKNVQIDVGGTVSETLTLESSNLRALGNTNYLLLELLPENESQNLAVATYRGTIVLSNVVEGGNLELLQEGKESLVLKLRQQFLKDQEANRSLQEKLALKETFASNEGLALLNLNQEDKTLTFRKALSSPMAWQPNAPAALRNMPAVSSQELLTWLRTGKMQVSLARKFCGFWFMDQFRRPLTSRGGRSLLQDGVSAGGWMTELCYRDVAENPKKYFEISYRYFLKNVSKAKDLSAEIKDLSFNHSFTVSQAHDESTSKTISADVNGGINTSKWMSPFSLGGGFRYQIARSESERSSNGNSSVVQVGESLLLEKLNFQMQASGYEKCAVIRLNPEILDPERTPLEKYLNKSIPPQVLTKELSYGLMFCEGSVQNRNVVFTESYFVLNQKNPYTQAIDSNSDFGRPLFMTLRGLNDFRRLLALLGGQLKTPGSTQSQSTLQQSAKANLKLVFEQGIATYPGQYAADE